METQHTPGPWYASGVIISGPDGMIGEVGFGTRDDPEVRANAHLIAAAPDLLKVVQMVADGPVRDANQTRLQILVEDSKYLAGCQEAANDVIALAQGGDQ